MYKPPFTLDDIERNDNADWETIKTCEAILEKYPEDLTALSALASSYERTGDAARARELYLELGTIMQRDGLWSQLQSISEHLLTLDPDDKKALELKEQTSAAEVSERNIHKNQSNFTNDKLELEFDLNSEIDLAWLLLQNELITQEQYEKAISGLTESRMSSAPESTLTLLQELAEMERINIASIISFLSAYTSLPYIEVHRFEPDASNFSVIPFALARRLGVLPFARMGDEWQVAVQNPLDNKNRQMINDYTSRKTHFFLTSPESMQNAIRKIENTPEIMT